MPKGPKGERRPADLNLRALSIVRVATGEESDPESPPRGQAGGKVGGKARKASLTPEKRREIAKIAAAKRWGKG